MKGLVGRKWLRGHLKNRGILAQETPGVSKIARLRDEVFDQTYQGWSDNKVEDCPQTDLAEFFLQLGYVGSARTGVKVRG